MFKFLCGLISLIALSPCLTCGTTLFSLSNSMRGYSLFLSNSVGDILSFPANGFQSPWGIFSLCWLTCLSNFKFREEIYPPLLACLSETFVHLFLGGPLTRITCSLQAWLIFKDGSSTNATSSPKLESCFASVSRERIQIVVRSLCPRRKSAAMRKGKYPHWENGLRRGTKSGGPNSSISFVSVEVPSTLFPTLVRHLGGPENLVCKPTPLCIRHYPWAAQ